MADARPWRWRLAAIAAVAVSGTLVALALVSLEEERLHLKPVSLPAEIQECSRDVDCILVNRIGCCSCKSGGARGAIRATARDGLRRFLKSTCRRRGVCVRVDTCRYDLAPACEGGRCVARVKHG